jgi:hypothetical protein
VFIPNNSSPLEYLAAFAFTFLLGVIAMQSSRN